MRLIDADELIEHVWRDRLDSRERIANLVESIPTIKKTISAVDVAPVVHRQWIRGKYTDDDLRHNDYSYRCNRCGKIVDFEENYCPDCGAKMDGGKS